MNGGAILGYGGLVARIALFVLGGSPLVALVWNALNELTAGTGSLEHLLFGVPAAMALAVWLILLRRAILRWHSEPSPPSAHGNRS